MTIRQISIPFDDCQQQGCLNIPIFSKKQFLEAVKRVKTVSEDVFYQERSFINYPHLSSYLFLPNRVTLNSLKTEKSEVLSLVCSKKHLWIGVIPSCGSSKASKTETSIYGRRPISHYRLDDFQMPPQRLNVKRDSPSLFFLPLVSKIHQDPHSQLCSINNVSFLLLFSSNQKESALVCCTGSLPSASFAPVLCCKEIELTVADILPIHHGNISIPFLMGKKCGTMYLSILSFNQWQEKVKIFVKKTVMKCNGKFISTPTLVVLPSCASFDLSGELKGINCFLFQHENFLKIGFLPQVKSDKTNPRFLTNFHRCLLDVYKEGSKNHYLPGDAPFYLTLNECAQLRREKGENVVKLIGYSLFLLASEDGKICSLFFKKGNFELKCAKSASPEKGSFPIKRNLEQSPSEESSAKRARIEKLGESSQKAVQESRQTIESKREEEARKACIDALFLFAQQEQH